MPSLYDLMQPNQPAMFDIYDAPNVGPSASPTPASQPGMGGQDWVRMLTALAQQGGGGTPIIAQGQSAPPTPPRGAAAPMAPRSGGSRAGFISDSRSGFNIDDLMKVAAIVGTMGAGAGALGAMGAAGSGAGAAGGAAGAGGGMGSMGGIMSMLGGMGGGGGAGINRTPR